MVTFKVNGRTVQTEKNQKLLRFLRDELHLTSVKDGCSEGACGACTVIIDGKTCKACVPDTDSLDGREVITVEGLTEWEEQVYTYAYGKAGAVQCGFCIPGMVMCTKALLDVNKTPSDDEIRYALRNNYCRCTGYVKIMDAVRLAAKILDAGVLPNDGDQNWAIGNRVSRIDVEEKVLGTGRYPDDFYLDGMLYGTALRSQYARARVLSIDTSKARALDGVEAVVTAGDIPGENKIGHLKHDQYTLIPVGGLTHYLGDAIALVAAKDRENKLVTEPGSRRSGRPAVHAQTLAVYNIFKGLKTAHPGLEIESCSSGGGRVDLGILEHADRIWVSDCVDPVERADIQRYTSLLVPPAMMGEHVGASPAHSTQRATSQELRMAMAFFGHMGIEWNLLKEPDEALAKLAVWVAEFKKHRDWFAIDTCVHADSNDPAVRLDGMVMPNRDAAIYRFTQLTTSQTYPAAPVHLPGLDPERTYRVSPLDPSLDLTGLTNGQSTLGWWNEEGVVLTGEALQRYGIRPPSLHPQQAVLLKAVALS